MVMVRAIDATRCACGPSAVFYAHFPTIPYSIVPDKENIWEAEAIFV